MNDPHILIWKIQKNSKVFHIAAKIGKNSTFENMLVSSKDDASNTLRTCLEKCKEVGKNLPVYYTDWDFGPIEKRAGTYGYALKSIISGREQFITRKAWTVPDTAQTERENSMRTNIRLLYKPGMDVTAKKEK